MNGWGVLAVPGQDREGDTRRRQPWDLWAPVLLSFLLLEIEY